jgi:hypothetical protein
MKSNSIQMAPQIHPPMKNPEDFNHSLACTEKNHMGPHSIRNVLDKYSAGELSESVAKHTQHAG